MTNYNDKEIELIKAKAIQEYLLLHGTNDEQVNSKVRELEFELKK